MSQPQTSTHTIFVMQRNDWYEAAKIMKTLEESYSASTPHLLLLVDSALVTDEYIKTLSGSPAKILQRMLHDPWGNELAPLHVMQTSASVGASDMYYATQFANIVAKDMQQHSNDDGCKSSANIVIVGTHHDFGGGKSEAREYLVALWEDGGFDTPGKLDRDELYKLVELSD